MYVEIKMHLKPVVQLSSCSS